MATSKVLQTPQIIEIRGSSIRVANPVISGNVKTFLRAPVNAAGTTLSVADNSNFANGDYLIIGSPGDSQTEEVNINGAVTLGTSLTVANTLKFGHELEAEVTKIYERKVRIYGSASDGGSLTLIATVDIDWDKPFTEYTLVTTDTAYNYYAAKFYDGTTESSASDYVAASGVPYNAIENFIQQALDITGAKVDHNGLTRAMCVRWAQDCQDEITQFVYKDSQTNQTIKKDWSFEVIEDVTSITLVQNQNSYALTLLSNTPKYPNHERGIISLRIGKRPPLHKTQIKEFDERMRGRVNTTTSVLAVVGATTLDITDTSELSESGSIYVGSDIITYTGKSSTQITGIPTSGTGSITTAHASGSQVWQNISPGLPQFYTIFNGRILLDRPVSEEYAGQKLKIRYLYAIPRITTVADITVIPFTNVFQLYIGAKIELRRKNTESYVALMQKFDNQVLANAMADMVPVVDSYVYHNIEDPFDAVGREATIDDEYYDFNFN